MKAKKPPILLPILFTFLAGITFFIALLPQPRTALRKILLPDYRKILSTVEGKVFPNHDQTTIIKIQTGKKLSLEIYKITKKNSYILFQKIDLGPLKDAHLTTRHKASNLLLEDANSDQVLDILAPTFDEKLKPQLRVFSYESGLRKFVEL